MSYNQVSNREGNQRRVMEMHRARMPPNVIAAYMTSWHVPMTTPDVQGIINCYEPMGERAVKKSDVDQAIKTHRVIEQLGNELAIDEDADLVQVVFHDDDESEAE